MSEERQAGRQSRSGFEDDAWTASGREACEEPASHVADAAALPIVHAAPPLAAVPGPHGRFGARRSALARHWRVAGANLRGSVYMLSALLFYAVMVGAMKHVGGALPLVQILLIRQVIMSLIIIAVARTALPRLMRTERPGLQVARGIVTLVSMLLGFTAMIKIPLAQATAIGFSQVLFVTIAAVLFLKETVDARRWVATVVGFGGVLIMLDPASERLDPYAIMALGGALFGAAITVSVRMMAATERTETILLYQGVVLILMLALPCWWLWTPPSGEQWFWIAVLSVFGTAGQWLLTRAYQVGEAAALAPLDFSRLILASFTGFVFFAEIPALSTWAGAAIVIGATLYTIRRNSRPPLEPIAAP